MRVTTLRDMQSRGLMWAYRVSGSTSVRVTTLRAVPSTALMWTYRVSGEYIYEGHNSEGRAEHSFNVDVQGKCRVRVTGTKHSLGKN